jgi:hypothetical protein
MRQSLAKIVSGTEEGGEKCLKYFCEERWKYGCERRLKYGCEMRLRVGCERRLKYGCERRLKYFCANALVKVRGPVRGLVYFTIRRVR